MRGAWMTLPRRPVPAQIMQRVAAVEAVCASLAAPIPVALWSDLRAAGLLPTDAPTPDCAP
jgi:hypothetical protein